MAFDKCCWLGRQDSNLRSSVPKTAALPAKLRPNSEADTRRVFCGIQAIPTKISEDNFTTNSNDVFYTSNSPVIGISEWMKGLQMPQLRWIYPNFMPRTSSMSYSPGFLPCPQRAAFNAPRENIRRSVAKCLSTIRSPSAANMTSCSPTTSPPRMA